MQPRQRGSWFLILQMVLWIGFTFPGWAGEENAAVREWQKKRDAKYQKFSERPERRELQSISEKLQQWRGGKSHLSKPVPPSRLPEKLTRFYELAPDLLAAVGQNRTHSDWQVRYDPASATPIFIEIRPTGRLARPASAPLSAPVAAKEFLQTHKQLFRLNDPPEELLLREAVTDRLGKQHVVFRQIYRGVPLWGQELTVHLDRDGQVYAVNARYSPTPQSIELSARLSAADAIQIAEGDLNHHTAIRAFNPSVQQFLAYDGPRAEQYIWKHPQTRQFHLVWHVQIRPNLRDFWYYFVDAHSGAILEKYNATAFDGPATATATDLNGQSRTIHVYEVSGTYYMLDGSRPIFQQNQPDLLNDPKGALWTVDLQGNDLNNQAKIFHVTSPNNTWNDAVSVSAHYNVGQVFEYFFTTHNRQAIDGKGSTIISVIHVTDGGQGMDNAFWNGVAMAYGDGNQAFKPLAGALDVAAHEMAHGVIQHTVNLEYKFQSGALNESFADVFGVMVDREDWRLGEDVVQTTFFPSGALRDMADPHNGGNSVNDNGWQPAHMNEFLNLTIDQDNGGVHINSGIPNKACQLIGEAIGKDKTEQIYYRVLDARYLNSQSNFVDMRLGAIRAAKDLFGENAPEVAAVIAAFDAVGIVGDTGTPPPDDNPPVQGEEWVAMINAEPIDNSLFLVRPVINNPATDIVQLTTTQVFTGTGNPISVADDGTVILFIDQNNFIRAIGPDGTNEQVISQDGVWSSIALSPDGGKLAATTVFQDTSIYVFDLLNPANSKAIRLYTPTTGQGTAADVTLFADALDWDFSGQFLIYDAFNRIPQASGAAIEYWDVNVLEVANEIIYPIFPPQEEGLSIGNPSFAQTNDNFFVFDFVNLNQGTDMMLAVDLFSGEIGTIEANGSSIGYPRYSPDDSRIAFERFDPLNNAASVRQIPVAANKIQSAGPSEPYVIGGQRPAWFAIGTRPVGIETGETELPEDFSLAQNYPNPFNPTTTIPYELPVRGKITLAVFDITGQRIQILDAGEKPAGRHSVRWDGRNQNGQPVASGMYFYRLTVETGNGRLFTKTRKMIYLK